MADTPSHGPNVYPSHLSPVPTHTPPQLSNSPTPNAPTTDAQALEFRYIHSVGFAELLELLGISLFVSTYQAGKLMVVQGSQGKLSTLLRNFEQVMGIALGGDRLAIGSRKQVHFFDNVPNVGSQLEPDACHDAYYVPRRSHVTSDIRVHEMVWINNELWLVNTRFSCLCTLYPDYSFMPKWRPSFVSALAPEDRCHLNGIAVVNGKPKYVSCFSPTDTPQGWRDRKVNGGCVIDLTTNDIIAEGFAMPHSPRVYANNNTNDPEYKQGQGPIPEKRLWLLDSGRGHLVTLDPMTGVGTVVAELPGFTRGLAFYDRYAFVGLSQIREKETFGGLPIEDKVDELKCGIWVVDIYTGQSVAFLEFQQGCTELFDIQILPNSCNPMVLGFQRDTLNNAFILPI